MIKNIKTPEAEVIRLKSLLNGAFLDLKQAEVTRLKLVKKPYSNLTIILSETKKVEKHGTKS